MVTIDDATYKFSWSSEPKFLRSSQPETEPKSLSLSQPECVPIETLNMVSDWPANHQHMDRDLHKACSKGDIHLLNNLLLRPTRDILLATTPHGNNCLHIAAMCGHKEFAKEVWSEEPSLFSGTNIDGETPLIAALMASNASLASDMIIAASQLMQPNDWEAGKLFHEMLLKADRRGENALHHALRNGFEDLALHLLNKEPRLSEQVSYIEESPMHMASRRGCDKVVEILLTIPTSQHIGPHKATALSAAVRAGNTGIVRQLLKARPALAYWKEQNGVTPIQRAINYNNLQIVKILLEHDHNLAYIKNGITDESPFCTATRLGFMSIVEEIMNTCPDSVCTPDKDGNNALNLAIQYEQPKFMEYYLKTPQLRRLINQAANNGILPLHDAAEKCEPNFIRFLLSLEGQDSTAVDVHNYNAVNTVLAQRDLIKTLKWNESFTLLSDVIPSGWSHTAGHTIQSDIKDQSIQEVKSLINKYTSNTSVVAVLLATITFAAAFTLPGGFNSDSFDVGQPIFAKKAAFQVFLISDTIAMCSSLAVAFLCILATWEDLDYLLNYRKTTRALMWCAYGTTALAFGTALFTVLAPKNLWLAVLILVLCSILPFFSSIIGEWPLLKLRYRLGSKFRKDLIPNI